MAAHSGGGEQAGVGPAGTPMFICGLPSNLSPILSVPSLSLGLHTHIHYPQFIRRVIGSLYFLFIIHSFLPISFKPELLSDMLYKEQPGVATSQTTLGLDSSFPCRKISEAHYESAVSFQVLLGHRLPDTWTG